MVSTDSNKRAFLVRITGTQNATWQGTITWIDDQEVRAFRSALELLKLIDSTLKAPVEK